MKLALVTTGVLVALFAGLFGLAWLQMAPPPTAEVPELQASVTLRNVTIIEPGSKRRTHQTVLIRRDKIAEVRDATADEQLLPVRYVLPGMVDAHIHQPLALGGLPDYFALLYLKHGVTVVRYTGHSDTGAEVERHARRIADGRIPGPRVFSCGPMIDGEPPLWSSSVVVTDPADAEGAVAGLADSGVDCIKVYSRLNAEVLAAVVAASRDRALPVVGHVPAGVRLEASGIDDVQHLIGVPEIVPDPQTGNPMAFGWQDLAEERVEAIAAYSVREQIAHTPTLVFLWTNSMRDRHRELIEKTSAHLVPRLFRDVAWLPQETIRLGGTRTSQTQDELRQAYGRALEAVGVFHAHGVQIHAGTDTANPFVVPGAALVQEIGFLSEAGLDNESALAAASTAPRRFLGLSAEIRPGVAADLVVLRDDPVATLDALKRVETVIADGRVYSADFLDREIERYQAHYTNFTWETLLPGIVGLMR